MNKIKCVLFDLDGTLLDTSYDFCYALSQTCKEFKQPCLSYQEIRSIVSEGGEAMAKAVFPENSFEEISIRKKYFLEVYFENIALHTRVFPGLEKSMELLAKYNIPWGIVTNKPTWLTKKLLESFEFPSTPKTIICGDTLSVSKPNRQLMDLAAKECRVANKYCLYLGDHPRDIEAGINAKMQTGAAMYGYLPEGSIQQLYLADYCFATPYEISQFLETCFNPHIS